MNNELKLDILQQEIGHNKICRNCSKPFVAKRTDAIYCNRKCAEKSFLKNRSLYYIKYRSLCQKYSKAALQYQRDKNNSQYDIDIFYDEYHAWNEWAKNEVKKTKENDYALSENEFSDKLKDTWAKLTGMSG